MPANDAVEVHTGAVVPVRACGADTPERGGLPVLDKAAIELNLNEFVAHVAKLEVAVNAADGIGATLAHPALAALVLDLVGHHDDLASGPTVLVVQADLEP